jgi:SAM dependent carboxyl methyltransferase
MNEKSGYLMPKSSLNDQPAMQGNGFYNENSDLQKAGIDQFIPIWRDLVESINLGANDAIIADYASSQGKNSLSPINIAVDSILSKNPKPTCISVIHIDLPSNDFSSLFETIKKNNNSYLNNHSNIFPFAVGRSYFDQILPSDSVDIGWNSWSLQWLNATPANIDDHIFIDCTEIINLKNLFSRQLALDWEQFLRCRSKELKIGGKLMTIFIASSSHASGWGPFWNEFWLTLLELRNFELLSDKELTLISLPIGIRSIEDIKQPFNKNNIFANLKLENLNIIDAPDPFWEEYQITSDPKAYGLKWANMAKAVAGPMISNVLNTTQNSKCPLNDIFTRFADRLSSNPFKVKHSLACVVVEKIN